MSVAFQSFDDPLSLAAANEIVLAYSERRQAVGQSAVAPLTSSDDPRDKTLWREMQNWIVQYHSSFVNHVHLDGPVSGGVFRYWVFNDLCAAAGVAGNDFYRQDGQGRITLGKIEAGDYRVRPNFDDLQKLFGMLRWATHRIQATHNTGEGVGCDYPEKSWYPDYFATEPVLFSDLMCDVEILTPPSAEPCNVDDYLVVDGVSFNAAGLILSGDFDCLNGVIGARVYNQLLSFGSFAKGSTVNYNIVDTKRNVISVDMKFLAKWDFTNI